VLQATANRGRQGEQIAGQWAAGHWQIVRVRLTLARRPNQPDS
jgi:hypothetical protein